MSSSPDHDMSDSSRSSQSAYEYFGSPPQQVPELTHHLTGLSCGDKNGNVPYLVITEQPQNHFRFRYVSEMVGTHGCLLGKSYATNKTKTHPSVELRNFKGRALIRCQLAQNKNPDEHPHKLLEEEQDRDVSYIVPERGSYRVGFAGMGIIHTAKKDVPDLLFRKYMDKCSNQANVNTKELRAKCEAIAKTIDLNIVRLKFSAYDAVTGKKLCEPVFSEPIHNMKSASTNDLKICRMSKGNGRPRGGDDVFIFVEKVNKKNIQVWFYEEDSFENVIWQAQGIFMQSDVHHQYGIVFRTPPYNDLNIANDVAVNVKLVRPSDGRSSEPKKFIYKAEPTNRNSKKRKATSSYSSLDSSSGSGSINSICNVPATVLNANPIPEVFKIEAPETFQHLPTVSASSPSQCDLGDAFMASESSKNTSPMWSPSHEYVLPTAAPQLPNLQLDSTELNKLLDTTVSSENKAECLDYLSSLDSLSDLGEIAGMNFMRSLQMLQPDSARLKNLRSDNPDKSQIKSEAKTKVVKQTIELPATGSSEKKETDEYSAFYRSDHGLEVKKLVNELYALISNKSGYKKQTVRDKLEKLFDIRLSNGDTFLHMTLCSNQPSFKNIVKIIHSVNMSRLFDYYNDKRQTVLHIAIAYDMPNIVKLLIANGCNPMMKDLEGDTAVHYAVRSPSCLEPLLGAIDQYKVKCDVNDYNDDNQTPLHLCSTGANVRLLVSHGASYTVQDSQGRLPLHIAAYDNNLEVMQALLDLMSPTDVDVRDGGDNTALQIVCDGPQRKNTTAMAKLLLEKMADPLKHEVNTESAWSRARDKTEIRSIMKWYMTSVPSGEGVDFELKDDIKSEPEDDYESADENEISGLPELSLYEHELSAALDYSGGWRPLASHLQLDNTAWYSAQPSASRTLLKHIKECREMTSQSLVLILQDLGEVEAAKIIKRYIE